MTYLNLETPHLRALLVLGASRSSRTSLRTGNKTITAPVGRGTSDLATLTCLIDR